MAIPALLCIALIIDITPWFGLFLVSLAIITDWHFPASPDIANISGIQIKVSDIICLLLALSLIYSIRIRGASTRLTSANLAAVTLMTVLTISVVIGTYKHGMAAAVNEARPWAYTIIVSYWCYTKIRHKKYTPLIYKFFIYTGLAISAVWIANTWQYGLADASSYVDTREVLGQQVDVGRATTAGQTLFLAASLLITLNLHKQEKRHSYAIISILFAAILLFAQHRSVWVSAFFMIGLYILFNYRQKMFIIFGLIFVPTLSLLLSQAMAADSLTTTLGGSASDTRTFEGRVFDWIYSLRELLDAGTEQVLLGWEFGRGYVRPREDGLIIDYIPHSWYVGTVLRAGLIGLVSGLVWVISTWRLTRSATADNVAAPLLAGILVYAVTYNLQWYLAPLLIFGYLGHPFKTSANSTHESKSSSNMINSRYS